MTPQPAVIYSLNSTRQDALPFQSPDIRRGFFNICNAVLMPYVWVRSSEGELKLLVRTHAVTWATCFISVHLEQHKCWHLSLHLNRCLQCDAHLRFLRAGWVQMPVKDFLDDIRKQAGDDDDDDGEPGRAAGQQLNKDEVHVLCVKEWPSGGGTHLQLVETN